MTHDDDIKAMSEKLLATIRDCSTPIDFDALINDGLFRRLSANRYAVLVPPKQVPSHVRAQVREFAQRDGLTIWTFDGAAKATKRQATMRRTLDQHKKRR